MNNVTSESIRKALIDSLLTLEAKGQKTITEDDVKRFLPDYIRDSQMVNMEFKRLYKGKAFFRKGVGITSKKNK